MQHTPINISLYTPIRRLVYHHCHHVLIMYHWTEKSFLCLMVQNIYEKSNFSLMRVTYLDKKGNYDCRSPFPFLERSQKEDVGV